MEAPGIDQASFSNIPGRRWTTGREREQPGANLAGPNLEFLQQAAAVDTTGLKNWGVPFLRNLAALLILGLLLVWLFPTQLIWTSEQGRIHPWRSLLLGLLIFTFGWIIAILAIVLVIAFAIFLYWISLPYLAFLFGMLGLLAVGLAMAVFWLSIVFLSKLAVAYLVGAMLFNRFLPKYAQSRVLPLVVGVLLYALLASVPYLSVLVVVIATLFGLGAIWLAIMPRKTVETAPALDAQPAGDGLDVSVLPER